MFSFNRLINTFHTGRLRTQLILMVNISLGILMLGFVALDYRLELHSHLHEKTVALSEEARTMAAATLAISPAGNDALQEYIDATCDLMNVDDSPGHRISVQIGDVLLLSHAGVHAHHDGTLDASNAVTGTYTGEGIAVEISERRTPIVDSIRRAELGRIAAIGLGALIAAVILNGLLLHLVSRPLERMTGAIREIGKGNLGTTITTSANKELTELANEVSAMSNELAHKEEDRRAQLDRARRLQYHLLPTLSTNGAAVAIEYHPADEIAGDFVDVITCPNGDTVLCLADVVGHGIHAAMGSAVLKALVLASDIDTLSPAALLKFVNERFCETGLPEDFASMAVVRVRTDQSVAAYASAGHEPAIVVRTSGKIESLTSTGLLLGIDPLSHYEQIDIALDTGDRLVLLSDGISESSNFENQLLGRDAISTEIRASGPGDAARLASAIMSVAARHRGDAPVSDDSTVLVFTAQPVAVTSKHYAGRS